MPPPPPVKRRARHGGWLRRRRRIAKLQHRRYVSRRRFLAQGAGLAAVGTAVTLGWIRPRAFAAELPRSPVRPPTASHDDAAFQASCIRCGLCGVVCENGCIRFFGLIEGEHGALTPFVDVRRRSCTLCMRCTQICPSGALTRVEDEPEAIRSTVRMGIAKVDPGRCLSYLGRVCGYCYDACPLPNHAIRLTPPALPVVLAAGCVGCGRCVELCPQSPTAIDVYVEGA